MYENITPESIKSEILECVSDLDSREGSYVNTLVSPISYRIWELYQSLNKVVPIAYVDETSGSYIDLRAAEYGLSRMQGSKAKTRLYFTGKENTVIEEGSKFYSDDGHIYVLDQTLYIYRGSAEGSATALCIGASYNSPIGTITRQYINKEGIDTITNCDAASGGRDQESDVSLVNRLHEQWNTPAISGKADHYKSWAEEVEEVGEAKVLLSGSNPGLVSIVIVDQDQLPAPASTVKKCSEHLEKVRPVGVEVTIESARRFDIDINMDLILDKSVLLNDVKKKLRDNISQYIKTLVFKADELIYNQIALIILNTEGVLDYTYLTVNGTTEYVQIPENAVIVLHNLEVNVEFILLETKPYDPSRQYFIAVDGVIETIDIFDTVEMELNDMK